MQLTGSVGALVGVLAVGGLTGGCGAAQPAPSATVKPTAKVTPRPPTPTPVRGHISFLAPARGALVGFTLTARVNVSGRGSVRFRLDGGRLRAGAARAITYLRLAPGRHRLTAELVSASGKPVAATTTVHFDVRHLLIAASPPSASSAPARTTSSPAPVASKPVAPVPVAPSTTPPSPVPAPPPRSSHTSPSPSPRPPTSGGIPRGGGGDGDGDNRGGPGDGDGNV